MRRATKLHLKRNLRRLTGGGLAILILATLLFVLRLIWGYQAERQFTATRAALIADGVRLHIDRPAVADADNAALAVMDALNAIQLTDAEKKLLYSLNYDDIIDNTRTDEQRRELREILARNAPVFAALRVAATRKHVQWPDAKDTVWVWNAGGKFHDVRGLYHLLCISAMLAHETGDGAAALDDLHLLLVLADVADQDLNLIAHLVAARCRNLVAWVVERIVPELDLSQPAAMEAAVRLLRGLQPSPHYLDAPAIAWEIQVEYLTEYWLEKYGPSYSWWLHPLTLNGTARMLEKQRTIGVPAMRADNYQ
ncbi:MAG: hypothetical protein FWD53_10995, partial [Phycisphaerales bacterium]|nr:hypothetical protein [Phycisphaerales bacterium]